jgi:hypothetical protein
MFLSVFPSLAAIIFLVLFSITLMYILSLNSFYNVELLFHTIYVIIRANTSTSLYLYIYIYLFAYLLVLV